MSNDWRDGFLFVGNHLALDFLNTRPVIDGQMTEFLADSEALARWLAASGLISKGRAAPLGRQWSTPASTGPIEELHRLRENLRKVVFQMEGGDSFSASFVKNLNRLLFEHPYIERVIQGKSGLERRKRFAPALPEHVYEPLADAIADLLTNTTRSRIRKCKSCVLHFYDTSKKGNRVWCSMKICGNRAKVAAYAGRKRAAADDE